SRPESSPEIRSEIVPLPPQAPSRLPPVAGRQATIQHMGLPGTTGQASGIAISGVVTWGTTGVVLVELLVGVVDPAAGEIEADLVVLAHDLPRRGQADLANSTYAVPTQSPSVQYLC